MPRVYVPVPVGAQLLRGNRAVVVILLAQRLRAHGRALGNPDGERGVGALRQGVDGGAAAGLYRSARNVDDVPFDLVRRRGVVRQHVRRVEYLRVDGEALHRLYRARRRNAHAAQAGVPGVDARARPGVRGRAAPDGRPYRTGGRDDDVAGLIPVAVAVGRRVGVEIAGAKKPRNNGPAAPGGDIEQRATLEVDDDTAVLAVLLDIHAVAAGGACDIPDNALRPQCDVDVEILSPLVRGDVIVHVDPYRVAVAGPPGDAPAEPGVEIDGAVERERSGSPPSAAHEDAAMGVHGLPGRRIVQLRAVGRTVRVVRRPPGRRPVECDRGALLHGQGLAAVRFQLESAVPPERAHIGQAGRRDRNAGLDRDFHIVLAAVFGPWRCIRCDVPPAMIVVRHAVPRALASVLVPVDGSPVGLARRLVRPDIADRGGRVPVVVHASHGPHIRGRHGAYGRSRERRQLRLRRGGEQGRARRAENGGGTQRGAGTIPCVRGKSHRARRPPRRPPLRGAFTQPARPAARGGGGAKKRTIGRCMGLFSSNRTRTPAGRGVPASGADAIRHRARAQSGHCPGGDYAPPWERPRGRRRRACPLAAAAPIGFTVRASTPEAARQ